MIQDWDDTQSERSFGRIYSAPISSSLVLISGLSCKTTFNKELWTSSFPLYSMKPNLRNLFMKKLTRDRVVPIISASVSWLKFPTIGSGLPSLPKFASRRRSRARRFSLELNNWSTKSSSIRLFRVIRIRHEQFRKLWLIMNGGERRYAARSFGCC